MCEIHRDVISCDKPGVTKMTSRDHDVIDVTFLVATEHEYIRPTAKIRFTAKYRLETERPKILQRYENLDLYAPLEYVLRTGKNEMFTFRPETHPLIQPNILVCCSEAEEKILSSKNVTYIGGKGNLREIYGFLEM